MGADPTVSDRRSPYNLRDSYSVWSRLGAVYFIPASLARRTSAEIAGTEAKQMAGDRSVLEGRGPVLDRPPQ